MERFKFLVVSVEEKVALVRLNRPEVLNALNQEMLVELSTCFDSLASDDDVGAVIVTGSGEKAFAAGADIKQLTELDGLTALDYSASGQSVFDRIADFPKPVIAAVNGYCLGGGCELALACHIRVASENAKFGQPEVKLGLIPGYGGTQRLARLIGPGRAIELIATGDVLAASDAERIGLVNKTVPPEQLLDFTVAMARRIIANGPVAVRLAMEAVTLGANTTLEQGLKYERALFGLCCSTEDMKEGTQAFLEKRKPNFRSR